MTRLPAPGTAERAILATCRCCGWELIVPTFGNGKTDTCGPCEAGECGKEWVTTSGIDARSAAMDLIRVYVHRGDSEHSLRLGAMGVRGTQYHADIRGSHIHVMRVHGVQCDARFSLHDIYTACQREQTDGQQLALPLMEAS